MTQPQLRLVIMRGLPGSGKDTTALQWVAENPEHRARVNRDEIRFQLYGEYVLERGQEETVTSVQKAIISALLSAQKSVIISDTNLRSSTVKSWMVIGQQHNAHVTVFDVDTSLEESIQRNKKRAAAGGRNVPEEVIRGMYSRYFHKGNFPSIPLLTHDSHRKYIGDESLPSAYIFDVDGTTQLNTGGRGFYDWHRVDEDVPRHEVIEVAQRLKQSGADIIVVSGRDEVCREATERNLLDAGMPIDSLFMRPLNSTDKDALVKERILFNDIAPRWNVLGTFDDRMQVVRAWRAMGLTCYQVEEGNF